MSIYFSSVCIIASYFAVLSGTNYNFSFFIAVLPLWTVYKTLYFPQKVTQLFKSVNDGQTTIFYN